MDIYNDVTAMDEKKSFADYENLLLAQSYWKAFEWILRQFYDRFYDKWIKKYKKI